MRGQHCVVLLLLALLYTVTSVNRSHGRGQIPVEVVERPSLILEFSKIVCHTDIKVLVVYFENQTSLEYTSQILPEIMKCNISYITLRNKFRTRQLEAIRDDGILMYMVMLLNDKSQPLALSLIRKKSAAKHLSHVFLLVRQAETVSKAWLRSCFKQFWRIWLLNIVIIYWQHERLHIYRYNPFDDNYLIEVPLHGLPTLGALFPKIVPNMQRKPLRMCIYNDEVRAIFSGRGQLLGTDGLMAGYIAERLNATRMVNRAQSYGRHNLSADICFWEIASEYDDVAMNIRFLSPETFDERVEFTVAHNRDDLCVVVPKAKPAPTFWNIFRSFDQPVWLALLLSVLLANLFCRLAFGRHSSPGITLQLFAISLSMPLPRAAPSRSAMRLFLVFWLYFSMLICTAFRGNLTSMLVYRKNLPDIDTISALANSQYSILIRPRHMKHIDRFMSLGNSYERQVRTQMVIVPDKTLVTHFEQNNREFAYLEKFHTASFQVNARRHMQLGRPVFHLMQTCLVPFHAVYIVPLGSPYLGFLNTLIRSSHEFGFERYWDHIMNAAFIKSGAKVVHRRNNNHDNPVVLRIEHLHAVFFMWAMGTALAALTFIGEWATRNWQITRRRSRA